jgi:hypothetical protein
MPIILNIDDLRELARRRIPRAIFDYADGGSYDERTIRRNAADLDAMTFRQRVMVDVSKITLATSFLGSPVSMPLAPPVSPGCVTPTAKFSAQEPPPPAASRFASVPCRSAPSKTFAPPPSSHSGFSNT